jgi:hypothetical protein
VLKAPPQITSDSHPAVKAVSRMLNGGSLSPK